MVAESGRSPVPGSPTETEIAIAAEAVMHTRVKFGWKFGGRPAVMAIDLLMAEAALRAPFGWAEQPPMSGVSAALVEELQQFGAAHNRNGERRTGDLLFRAAERIRRLERKVKRAAQGIDAR